MESNNTALASVDDVSMMSTNTLAATAENVMSLDKPSFGDIPIECIQASTTNPRKIFAVEHLADLAASIKKHGVAQPILVRPIRTDEHGVTYFEIVAGERRYRASKLAGMPTVPAIVRTLSDIEALEIQVIENLQRQDLHPLEEAEGYEVLMKEADFTAEQMADKVGKSKAYIYASLKLCALEPKPRQAFYDGLRTKSTALLVARIPVKHLQDKCIVEITAEWGGVLSTRKAAEHIERNYMLNLKKATFKPSDASLCFDAGSCTTCPKRAGNQPEIFSDVTADVCTDPPCFKAKTDAHVIRIKQLATAKGQTVFSGAEAKKIMPNDYSNLRGGYVELDKVNHDDEKKRTYRQILGKQAPQTALIESPHSEKILEIVKIADIATILKEKGIAVPSSNGQDSDASRSREKEQEAKAKLERQYRTELFTQVHHASLLMNLVDADLRLVARLMFNNLPSNTIPTKLVMSLYGWNDETFGYPDRDDKLTAAFDALTPAQLNQLIRDCALSHELHVNVYTSYSEKDQPNRLLAMAERTKVDAKAIRKAIDDAAQAKADAKLKGPSKKAAARKLPPGEFDGITPETLAAFVQANPERVHDLTEFILKNRPLLVDPLEKAAEAMGLAYGIAGFTKTDTATAIAADVSAEEQQAAEGDYVDAGDFEPPPKPPAAKPAEKTAKPRKAAEQKGPANPAWPWPTTSAQATETAPAVADETPA